MSTSTTHCYKKQLVLACTYACSVVLVTTRQSLQVHRLLRNTAHVVAWRNTMHHKTTRKQKLHLTLALLRLEMRSGLDSTQQLDDTQEVNSLLMLIFLHRFDASL